jgi:hypothetical protein
MIYIVQSEVSPEQGTAMESNRQAIQDLIGKWQALNPIGMYFAITRRAMANIVDAPNEDALLEVLHNTWVVTNSYLSVTPVATSERFGEMAQRVA